MRKSFILTALVILIIISGIFGIRAIAMNFSSTVLNHTLSFLFGARNLVHFRSVVDENEALRSELFDLRVKLLESTDIRLENELLRLQLSLSSRKNYVLETVRIFNVSYEEITASAFVDKGKENGIDVGMPVITGKSILIGTISEIFDKYSKVMLLTDKRFKLTVLDEEYERFLAIGDGAGMRLDFVTPRDNFTEGELIVSDISKDIPGFLVVGEIISVSHNESDLFKKVKIKPAFTELDIRSGFVIKDF